MSMSDTKTDYLEKRSEEMLKEAMRKEDYKKYIKKMKKIEMMKKFFHFLDIFNLEIIVISLAAFEFFIIGVAYLLNSHIAQSTLNFSLVIINSIIIYLRIKEYKVKLLKTLILIEIIAMTINFINIY